MKRKHIMFLFLAVIAVIIIAGVYLWNKPPETVAGKEGIAIEATALADAYATNEQQANADYLSKVLEVSGTVAEIAPNQDGKTVLLLAVNDPLSGVQCTMKDEVSIKEGDMVTVKGFCNGYTSVVLLQDCIQVKK